MAVAKTETKIPLDTIMAIWGINPLHGNQVNYDGMTTCGSVYLTYDWQGPTAISRESIAYAVADAENKIEQYVGFPIRPTWYEDYFVKLNGSPLITPKSHFITGGRRTFTLIDAYSIIDYQDADSDGFFETAVVGPVATTVTDKAEISIFYPEEEASLAWKVTPYKVIIESGMVTIYLHRYDLVKKDELEALRPNSIDGVARS